MSLTGFKYFVTFVDDLSRVMWFYLMKSRFELFSHFSAFVLKWKLNFMSMFKH